jgi:hypothetical protein
VNLGGNGSTSPTNSTSPADSPVDSPTESHQGAITPSANSDFPSGNYVMFTSIKFTLTLCCEKLTIS